MQRGWSYLRGEFGEFIDVVLAQQQCWTGIGIVAPLIACTKTSISSGHCGPKHVLVLAGDPHLQDADYGPTVAYHVEKGADITVGVVEVPRWSGRVILACSSVTPVEPGDQLQREAARARLHSRACGRRARLHGYLHLQLRGCSRSC